MDMPESQKFGILRNIIGHEERPYVKRLFGMASYMKGNFYNIVMKISEEWDTKPADKSQATMAASMATQAADRICFKFQTNECVRQKCPFIHKILDEQEKKEQNYIAKVPDKKNQSTKPMKRSTSREKRGSRVQARH